MGQDDPQQQKTTQDRLKNQGANRMVKQNQPYGEGVQATFCSEEQERYWTLWHQHKGDSARVASICGVTTATVTDHLFRVAISMGFDGVKQAKKHFGYKSSVRREDVQIEAGDLKKLLEVQGYKCALSGVRLEPKNAELDHKVPLSRGGTNDLGNLQWLCKNVNRAKGAMDNEEFIAMCKQVAKQ